MFNKGLMTVKTRMFTDTDEQTMLKNCNNSPLAEGQLSSINIQVAIHNIVHHLQKHITIVH